MLSHIKYVVLQTSDLFYSIEVDPSLYYELEFKVSAVSSIGVVAETTGASPEYTDYYQTGDNQYNYDVALTALESEEIDTAVWEEQYDYDMDTEEYYGDEPSVATKPPFRNLAPRVSTRAVPSYRRSYHVALACCCLLTVIILCLSGILVWNHTHVRRAVTSRATLLGSGSSSMSFTRRGSRQGSGRGACRGLDFSQEHAVFLDEEATIGAAHL